MSELCGGRGAEKRSRRRGTSSLHREHGTQCRAQSQDAEIMTSADIKSRTFNYPRHPGALAFPLF